MNDEEMQALSAKILSGELDDVPWQLTGNARLMAADSVEQLSRDYPLWTISWVRDSVIARFDSQHGTSLFLSADSPQVMRTMLRNAAWEIPLAGQPPQPH